MRKAPLLKWGCMFLLIACFVRCSKSGGTPATGTNPGGGTTNPTQPPVQKDVPAVDNAVKTFMSTWSVPGMSIAVIHNDKLIYVKSYGKMSATDTTSIKNTSLFRLASVSKQITSAAIMKLLQDGKLTLDSKVFGTGGILANDYAGTYLGQLNDITIDQLLHHTTGNWPNDGSDPMFQHTSYSQPQLINWTFNNYTDRNRRGQYYYSNFGYCILGRVIEKLSGKSYEQYCKDVVLSPCGISDMVIGGNTLADRKSGEVIYNGQSNEDPYSMNVTRMDSHGGWIATATDLARFLAHVDGFSGVADILNPATITTMTTPSSGNPNYACGWAVNNQNNWWHNGSLPGTLTEIVRASNGFCWVMLCNTRSLDSQMDADLDNLLWPSVNGTSTPWEDRDQF
ncbi:serine hydrolase domain-containing protein [Flavitalea sp. BT771]|uniref:serine hydrolase domain-containing protein n=1 Tax=Flavitalea sp. BT771 TaxID=3063329 RepID=UPI0026E15AA1|nr:serine hydrolase domain-containing protein [Flavitalea sp. BT771]MDO6435256.1 serine hydrolase domain-containing protein [Flavitalea sp. BT771]MDV6224039.1 serine hydrolase domain-containing protein [Flavitalea sp. BT771]